MKAANSKMNFSYFKIELQKLLVFLPVERPDWEEHLNDLYTDYKGTFYPRGYSIEDFAEEWFLNWDTTTHHCMLKSKAIKQRDERIKKGIKPVWLKTLTLLLLTAFTIQAQERDTICFTKPEYERLSDTLQKGERAVKIIPQLRDIINNQSDTIIKYSIRNAQLQTSVLKYETAPKPKRGFWAMAGVLIGTLTGAILWAR